MDNPQMLPIVTELRERVRQDLWGRTMPFWMRYSIDQDCGGFFNCLDEVHCTPKLLHLKIGIIQRNAL